MLPSPKTSSRASFSGLPLRVAGNSCGDRSVVSDVRMRAMASWAASSRLAFHHRRLCFGLGGKVAAWKPHIALGAKLSRQYRKPVAFTEVGYCSGHCKRSHRPSSGDYQTHAQHYQALFEAFRNPNADVRKAVVFCLVDMYLVLGEQLTPHLEELSTSQLKLVTIYINKTTKARADQMHHQHAQVH